MGLDGLPKSSQINPYSDPVNPYLASISAEREIKRQEASKHVESSAKGTKARRKDEEDWLHEQGEKRRRPNVYDWDLMSEEERALLEKFAKIRGIMDFALSSGTHFVLQMNTDTGLIDLVAQGTGEVFLSLTPDEIHELSLRMERYAGTLTDRSA